jgi:uncharacterized repeat protein (TIGR03803 family)
VRAFLCSILLSALFALPSFAQTFEILHSFGQSPDGASPWGTLVRDQAGNLYGTTVGGGVSGTGTVFRIGPNRKETILYNFGAAGVGGDGNYPYAGLVRDAAGSVYGTTSAGGIYGAGTVFKVDSTGKESVLYSFAGLANGDGVFPFLGSLIRDATGNLYGTTADGGSSCIGNSAGCGTVFKVDSSGNETVLYRFPGGGDGATPEGSITADSRGNLYSTTSTGGLDVCSTGINDYGCGLVFRLNAAGKETVLYDFTGAAQGFTPEGGLIRDMEGNLYGTTTGGGGALFEITSAGTFTILHSFFGINDDGHDPVGNLVRDGAGNIYGTTFSGGAPNNGIVYKIDTAGNETVLWTFTGGPDGSHPFAGLVIDAKGNLYGASSQGGPFGQGTVFKIAP